MRAPVAARLCLALLASTAWAAAAGAQIRTSADPEQVVLEDAIAVELLGRELIAFDLEGSGQLVERLELDEEVLSTASRGRVALALTTRRVLAATPSSGSWRSERYHLTETPQEQAWVSQTLGLVLTSERVLAFFGTGNWVEQRLGPREQVVASRVGPTTAVVVTDRRALGIGSGGGFFPTEMRLGETVESVKALSGIATVTTSQRTLVFKGSSGVWVDRKRPLR